MSGFMWGFLAGLTCAGPIAILVVAVAVAGHESERQADWPESAEVEA